MEAEKMVSETKLEKNATRIVQHRGNRCLTWLSLLLSYQSLVPSRLVLWECSFEHTEWNLTHPSAKGIWKRGCNIVNVVSDGLTPLPRTRNKYWLDFSFAPFYTSRFSSVWKLIFLFSRPWNSTTLIRPVSVKRNSGIPVLQPNGLDFAWIACTLQHYWLPVWYALAVGLGLGRSTG